MKRGDKIISQIFENPALIKKISLEQIDEWIEETPYVQYLHLLKALKLKSEKVTDPSAYHMAATVVTDRIRMDELLSSLDDAKKEKQKKKNKKNKALIKKIESPDVSKDKEEFAHTAENSIEQEESIEEWNVHGDENDGNNSQLQIADGPVSKVESNSSQVELSEFSEWLLALESEDDAVSQEQVDDSINISGAAVSETLARLLEAQGHQEDAIEMYKKLSLTNPEKSAYFAALIEKLQKR